MNKNDPSISNHRKMEVLSERLSEVEDKFNSKSMCLAKWFQSTTHLATGNTHSCHHPSMHFIPVSEIKRNYKALHNTEFKVNQRAMMLSGERPPECGYCWAIEDTGGGFLSDRAYKTGDDWAYPNASLLDSDPLGKEVNPTYFEVSFDSTCNLKCMYCSPDVSSKWMEEITQHGPYNLTGYQIGSIESLKSNNRFPIPRNAENPYVDAFWEWWPELYTTLDTFRITGGEPLLSKNLWRVFDYILENPRPSLKLAINTNLQVPDALMDKFIKYVNLLDGKLESLEIYTSCEAHGEKANYIRTGMDYDSFMVNCRRVLGETNSRLNIMAAFNVLSLSSFSEFLVDIVRLREEFNEHDGMNRVPMMISYVRWPRFHSVAIAPKVLLSSFFYKILSTMDKHSKATNPRGVGRFYLEEFDQVKRLSEFAYQGVDDLQVRMRDFALFFREFDLRREVDFETVFPEYAAFMEECNALI